MISIINVQRGIISTVIPIVLVMDTAPADRHPMSCSASGGGGAAAAGGAGAVRGGGVDR